MEDRNEGKDIDARSSPTSESEAISDDEDPEEPSGTEIAEKQKKRGFGRALAKALRKAFGIFRTEVQEGPREQSLFQPSPAQSRKTLTPEPNQNLESQELTIGSLKGPRATLLEAMETVRTEVQDGTVGHIIITDSGYSSQQPSAESSAEMVISRPIIQDKSLPQPLLPRSRKSPNLNMESQDIIFCSLKSFSLEKTIGPEGGCIEILNCRVEFPPNAFQTPATVKITIRSSYDDALDGYIVISPEIECVTTPGIFFQGLATITLPVHALPENNEVTVLAKQDQDSNWEIMDVSATVDGRSASFQVSHFTVFKFLARLVPGLTTYLCHNLYFKDSTAQLLGVTCIDDESVKKCCCEMVQEKGFMNPLPIPNLLVSLCLDDVMSYRFVCEDPKESVVQPTSKVILARNDFNINPSKSKFFRIEPPPSQDVVAIRYFLLTPGKEIEEDVIALEWKQKITGAQMQVASTTTNPRILIQHGNSSLPATSQEAGATPFLALSHEEVQMADPVQHVEVCRSTRQFYDAHARSPDVYPIDPNWLKGKVLIINNEFLGQAGQRHGSQVDVENLENLWNQLEFQVTTKRNLRGRDMRRSCREFALDSVDINVLVLIIMSHGGKRDREEVICGEDNQKVSTEQIISYFTSENAPHLQGIPKVFMFQACRGEDLDQNVEELSLDTDEVPDRYPERSDMLIVYPSQAGYASFRNRETGSWLMNAVTTVFMRAAKDTHVLDMLTKVNRAISLKEHDGYVQMSNQVNYLTKNLFLFPGWPDQ